MQTKENFTYSLNCVKVKTRCMTICHLGTRKLPFHHQIIKVRSPPPPRNGAKGGFLLNTAKKIKVTFSFFYQPWLEE